MALTITGSAADSYISEDDADTYAGDYFLGTDFTAWDNATSEDKEKALRQATQFIDENFRDRFPGVIRSESQALEWPRSGARDRSGRTLNNVPDAVKNATVELAKERLVDGRTLVPSETRGGQVKREKVGPIEVEYMDGAPSGTVYKWAEKLLTGVLKPISRRVVRV